MKTILKKWSDMKLIVRILIGLSVGTILGMALPKLTEIVVLKTVASSIGSVVTLFGTVFVGALKGIAPLLVFTLVISSLSKAGKGIGNRFKTVIFLYILSTLLAAVVAVFASELVPVSLKLTSAAEEAASAPSGVGEVLMQLVANLVTNPIGSIINANYVGILFWAIMIGLALKKVATEKTICVFSDISDAVSKVVHWIIEMAPFGIMGLVYSTVSANGLSIFKDYGKLLLVLVGSMLVVALIVDPLIAAIFLKRNPYKLVFRCLKESGLTALFTRSSAANIPVNMELCEKLGMDKDFYSVSIPLGATINMDGAAITITVMTLAAANTLGIEVGLPTALILSIIATLGACGASGVAGGSLLLIPMACSLFGISNDVAMEVVAVGFIIGVVQDSVETALNSSGDVMFAATAEFHDRKKRGEEIDYKKIGI